MTTLLRALPQEDPTTGEPFASVTDDDIRNLFRDPDTGEPNVYIDLTLEKDVAKTPEAALVEVFKKQRPGEPPTLENSKALLRALFFDPKRYDLTRVGRYKLNSRLDLNVDPDMRVLTTSDLTELVRRLVTLPIKLGMTRGREDYAEEVMSIAAHRRRCAARSTSTSTSATGACARSASSSRRRSASACTAWSASSASG